MNAMVDVVVTTINLGAVSVSFLFLSCIPLTTIFIFVFAIIQLETVFITRVNAKHKDVCGDSTCKFRGVVSCDSVSTENEKKTSIREDFCGNDSSILFLGITGSLAYILHSISKS